MKVNEDMIEDIIHFTGEDDEEYTFCYSPEEWHDRGDKAIIKGRFKGKTPSASILPGERCVLIRIILKNTNYAYPAMRLFNDFLNYPHSRHLRKILAWNKAAAVVREKVKHSYNPFHDSMAQSMVCYLIQPEYQNACEALLGKRKQDGGGQDSFSRMSATAVERLEILLQAVLGLRELQDYYTHERQDADPQQVAHRDMKLQNIMILRGRKRFSAVLIDLASLIFPGHNANGQETTHPFLMSPANTTPEGICPNLRKKYGVTEKADVFALGTLLAELFGNRNPLVEWMAWIENKERARNQGKVSVEAAQARMAESYQNLLPEEENRRPGESWLEEALGDSFHWELPEGMPGDALERVQEIFFDATRISPRDRMSLEDLWRELCSLLRRCELRRNLDNPLLYDPDAPQADETEKYDEYLPDRFPPEQEPPSEAREDDGGDDPSVFGPSEAWEDDDGDDFSASAPVEYVCLFDCSDRGRIRDYMEALDTCCPEQAAYRAFFYTCCPPEAGSMEWEQVMEFCVTSASYPSRQAVRAALRDAAHAPDGENAPDGWPCGLLYALAGAYDAMNTPFGGQADISLLIFTPSLSGRNGYAPCGEVSSLEAVVDAFTKRFPRLDLTIVSDLPPRGEAADWYAWRRLPQSPFNRKAAPPPDLPAFSHAGDAPYILRQGSACFVGQVTHR